jgi:hypothetical protein
MPSSPVKDEGTDDRRQHSVAATTVDGSGSAVAIIRSRPVALVSVIFPALRVILRFRLLAFDMGTATGYPARRHGTSAFVERQGSHVPAGTEAAQDGQHGYPGSRSGEGPARPFLHEPRTWCDLSVTREHRAGKAVGG